MVDTAVSETSSNSHNNTSLDDSHTDIRSIKNKNLLLRQLMKKLKGKNNFT